jgi:hypothetical protein
MNEQIDYQILLQEVVKTAKEAAIRAKNINEEGALFAYYDILDVIKTQAIIMKVPLSEIGLEGFDPDELIR